MQEWEGQRILVTGCCGTVGSELLRQLTQHDLEVVGIDNNESSLFFQAEEYRTVDRVRFRLCDIRDRDQVLLAAQGVDIVLHAAALKHVELCELSPTEAIRTNILGTQSVIRAAAEAGVRQVLFTSSDKAVNPTNVMGTSKLMAERLMTAANAASASTLYASTRFGNVLGSRGSVIPLFRRQIAGGGPVTLTDPGMTRFIMTLEQAVALVLGSILLARGGEVFVTKMPVVRIEDLAQVMITVLAPLYGYDPSEIELKTIGSKPGEKLYEELISREETRRTVELTDYFCILPAFREVYDTTRYSYPGMGSIGVEGAYNSAQIEAMSAKELNSYLNDNGLLEEDL